MASQTGTQIEPRYRRVAGSQTGTQMEPIPGSGLPGTQLDAAPKKKPAPQSSGGIAGSNTSKVYAQSQAANKKQAKKQAQVAKQQAKKTAPVAQGIAGTPAPQSKASGTPSNPAKLPKQKTEAVNLGTALAQYLAPYVTQASAQAPNLSQYLGSLPAGIVQALQQQQQGLSNAYAGQGSAIQQQGQQAGQAGLLADLLNAAKYQAIYKQDQYAPAPPANTPLGSLYQSVIAGGNALTGGLTAVNPATSNTSSGSKNPPNV